MAAVLHSLAGRAPKSWPKVKIYWLVGVGVGAYVAGIVTSPLLDNVCAMAVMAGYVLFQLTGYHP
jgi:hypothetical protein